MKKIIPKEQFIDNNSIIGLQLKTSKEKYIIIKKGNNYIGLGVDLDITNCIERSSVKSYILEILSSIEQVYLFNTKKEAVEWLFS